jgi:hypothetical protein
MVLQGTLGIGDNKAGYILAGASKDRKFLDALLEINRCAKTVFRDLREAPDIGWAFDVFAVEGVIEKGIH